MNALSFDIGTEYCAVVEGIAKKDGVEILQALVHEMPTDYDAGDKALITPYAADAISQIMRSAGFKTKGAIITANINYMMIRDFLLPDGKFKELDGMVRNEMINNYSADSTDVIQFIKRPVKHAPEENLMTGEEANRKDGGQTGIRAISIKRSIVDSYYSLLQRLKLTPLAMDFHANAVEKLIRGGNVSINNMNMADSAYLMVDFGSSGTIVHAVAENSVFISRYIPMGLYDLDKIIADREFISVAEAKSYRADKIDLLAEEDPGVGGDLMKAVRGFLHQWNDAIQKVSKFFQNRQGLSEIDSMYLYGAGAHIRGLPEYLSAAAGTNAYRLESLSGVSFRNNQDQQKICLCLNAIGALIRL